TAAWRTPPLTAAGGARAGQGQGGQAPRCGPPSAGRRCAAGARAVRAAASRSTRLFVPHGGGTYAARRRDTSAAGEPAPRTDYRVLIRKPLRLTAAVAQKQSAAA